MTGAQAGARTAERVLGLVGDAAEAAVTVTTGTSGLTRFANSAIHQNVAEELSRVLLSVAVDGGRTASATTTATDDAALQRLVESTLAAARLRPVDESWPGLAPPTPPSEVDSYDPDTAAAGPDQRAEIVRSFVEAGGGLRSAGFCSTSAVEDAFANSAGQRQTTRGTQAVLDGIVRTETSDGSARQASAGIDDLDGERSGRRATAKAVDGADAGDLPPGRYEVVLEPGCVADLLSFFAIYGFNARAVVEGRSFAAPGQQQFDPAISLYDDAGDPLAVGPGFDVEGTPKTRLDLVSAGITSALAHDRRTAAAAGTISTGHAIEGGESFGPVPSNLFLAPGPGGDAAAMVKGMDRGLLVTDFWYTRILDPRTQVVTGLTRNGVFLVEGGEVVRPVRNLRFTQSYVGALAPGAVKAVGSDQVLVPTAHYGTYGVPSLHLAGWNFTGGAKS
ncbi:MAG: TldD/PmbA family protein [Mycobacteriales bacterium]